MILQRKKFYKLFLLEYESEYEPKRKLLIDICKQSKLGYDVGTLLMDYLHFPRKETIRCMKKWKQEFEGIQTNCHWFEDGKTYAV